jgi:hypothetical protein
MVDAVGTKVSEFGIVPGHIETDNGKGIFPQDPRLDNQVKVSEAALNKKNLEVVPAKASTPERVQEFVRNAGQARRGGSSVNTSHLLNDAHGLGRGSNNRWYNAKKPETVQSVALIKPPSATPEQINAALKAINAESGKISSFANAADIKQQLKDGNLSAHFSLNNTDYHATIRTMENNTLSLIINSAEQNGTLNISYTDVAIKNGKVVLGH